MSSLKVISPQELANPDGGFDHGDALFGAPPYGEKIEASVYYSPNMYGKSYFCSMPKYDPVGDFADETFILLIDRGGDCTFVTKVRNAQSSGAAAVIIADSMCQCKHEESGICKSSKGTVCEEREPMMADDGSESDIQIPALLMWKQDSDKIKATLENGEEVRIEMAWSVPNSNYRVELDLWSVVFESGGKFASGGKSEQFQKMWLDAQEALGDTASFTPHYYIYDGLKAMCRDEDGIDHCYTLCTNHGRYCAIDPDNDLEKGISGADIVKESLVRLCIWDIYGNDGTGLELLQYVREFEQCKTTSLFKNRYCIEGAFERAGINGVKVDKCIEESGGLDTSGENTLLQAQLDEVEATNIIVLPVVYVNGVPLRGDLNFDVVFKAVCAGYHVGVKPDICTECATCDDYYDDSEYNCVIEGYCVIEDEDEPLKAEFGGVLTKFGGVLDELFNTLSKEDLTVAPTPTPTVQLLQVGSPQSATGNSLQLVKGVVAGILITSALMVIYTFFFKGQSGFRSHTKGQRESNLELVSISATIT